MTLSVITERLPAMSDLALTAVRSLEEMMLKLEPVPIKTHHLIHGKMYTRTIFIKKGVLATGVLIKIPTTLVISGDLTVFTGTDEIRVTGHAVVPGSAGRKQAVYANEDTSISMSFPTNAMSIDEVENEFTDEVDMLGSRKATSDQVVITGE